MSLSFKTYLHFQVLLQLIYHLFLLAPSYSWRDRLTVVKPGRQNGHPRPWLALGHFVASVLGLWGDLIWKIFLRWQPPTVTILRGSVCLHSSKPNKTRTGVCSQESKGSFLGSDPCAERQTGELMLEDLAPHSFQRMGSMREIINHGD